MLKIVEKNPKILSGATVIKGTRIPVARVLALIGMDYSLSQMKRELPDLKILQKKDLADILAYYQTQLAKYKN